ncbi:MAG: hypothetical protein H6739_35625 [Alphaproteobacteria bacterium]|nr:hypothetical protein [Alphaproteobacteria bacterium]
MPLRPALIACALGSLVACSPPVSDQPGWLDEVEASGPCYRANLLDGLSTASTDELHDTFDCLNRTGLLEPLSPVVDALDTPTRSGEPAGVELALAIEAARGVELDLFGLAGGALDLLQSEDRPLELAVRASVELLYGTSWTRLANGEVNLQPGSSLDNGVVRPLLPGLRRAATATLDDDLLVNDLLADALESPLAVDALHTVAALSTTDDAGLRATLDDLPRDVADAIERSRDASNDRWAEASGDSLRDLSDKLMVETGNDGRIALEHLADPARVMLADETLRDRMGAAFRRLDTQGRLRPVPPQLLYLAQVDAEGGSLQTGEDSALVTLLRLIHDANTPMRCSLDLWVTNLDVDLGNLSVSLLEEMAQLDPSTVTGGVDLLGTVIGWPLSQGILESVADSGVCPALDRQMVADLESIDRFNDPETSDLLIVILDVLDAVYDGPTSRMPELVDILATVHAFEATEPFEELLRDVGTRALVYDVLDLVPVVLDPAGNLDTSSFPEGAAPLDFDGVWAIAQAAFSPRGSGRTAVEELAPALRAITLRDETWVAIGNLGGLLDRTDAETGHIADLIAPIAALDPELEGVRALAPALRDDAIAGAALRILETPEVVDAVGRAEVSREGPMPWYARLVTGGTLDAVLAWMDWTFALLEFDDTEA